MREGKELQGSGLDVTWRAWHHPACASSCRDARAWWLKRPGPRPQSGVRLPDALERKYPRAGHSRPVGSGFCAAHAFDRSTERVSCVAITCMTRPFSAPSNARTRSRHHEASPHRTLRHSSRRQSCSAAVTTFEPCRICSAIPTASLRLPDGYTHVLKVGGAGALCRLMRPPHLTSER